MQVIGLEIENADIETHAAYFQIVHSQDQLLSGKKDEAKHN